MIDDKSPPDNGPQGMVPPEHPPLDHVPPDESPGERAQPGLDNDPQAREDGVAEHLTSRASWLRLLFMVLFVALWSLSRFVVLAVVILQVLFLLFGGKRNERLASFGASLATYTYELVAFLTFASERQPFPFSDWPADGPRAEAGQETE